MRKGPIFTAVIVSLITAAGITFALIGCGGEEEALPPGELTFDIFFEQNSYETGEEINCYMFLYNSDNKKVTVKKRLIVNHDFLSHDVYFKVTDPGGDELWFDIFVYAPVTPNEEDFETLEPLGLTWGIFPISEAYDLTKPGKYTVQAFYENTYEPPGLNAWTGSLESNTVEITIT